MRRTADQARAEILAAARRQFSAIGFKGSTISGIAIEAGTSKSNVLYHFPSKEVILRELLTPFWQQLERLATELRPLGNAEAQRVAMTAMAQVGLTFHTDLALFYGQLPELLDRDQFVAAKIASDEILLALVGRSSSLEAQVAGIVVASGVAAAYHRFQDLPSAQLHEAVTQVVRRLLADYQAAEEGSPGVLPPGSQT